MVSSEEDVIFLLRKIREQFEGSCNIWPFVYVVTKEDDGVFITEIMS